MALTWRSHSDTHTGSTSALREADADDVATATATAENICLKIIGTRNRLSDKQIEAGDGSHAHRRRISDTCRTRQIQKAKKSAGANLLTLDLLGSPTWTRTRDLRINSPSLYRLSYQGTASNYSVEVWPSLGGWRDFPGWPWRAKPTQGASHPTAHEDAGWWWCIAIE